MYEGECLKAALNEAGIGCTWLDGEAAILPTVQSVMKHHPWIHLACHGSQNREDVTLSAFELYDGPLTLSALMSIVAENAELAFLSACPSQGCL